MSGKDVHAVETASFLLLHRKRIYRNPVRPLVSADKKEEIIIVLYDH